MSAYVLLDDEAIPHLRDIMQAQLAIKDERPSRKLDEHILERLNDVIEDNENPERETYVKTAKEMYHRDGETEIDDNARVSISDDGGAYVMAWVWVNEGELDRDVEFEAEEEEEVEGEPHDLLCVKCGVQRNEQCLDPECRETDHHTRADSYCGECEWQMKEQGREGEEDEEATP